MNSDLLGMAYAVAYPFGVVGIILTMLLIQKTFRVDPKKPRAKLDLAAEIDSQIPDYIDLEVTNPNYDGIALRNLPFMAEAGIVFSR
jgi:putative transport protein